jgi:hypothetical protein
MDAGTGRVPGSRAPWVALGVAVASHVLMATTWLVAQYVIGPRVEGREYIYVLFVLGLGMIVAVALAVVSIRLGARAVAGRPLAGRIASISAIVLGSSQLLFDVWAILGTFGFWR